MHKIRRPLASIVLAIMILSIVVSDAHLVPAASPGSVPVVALAPYGPFAVAFTGATKTSTQSETQTGSLDPNPGAPILDRANARRLERSLSIQSLTIAPAVPAVFSSGVSTSRYAFGPAKNNQVLTFIDGRMVWRDPIFASVADFVTQPGSGRKPADLLHSAAIDRNLGSASPPRHFGSGGGGSSSTTTTVTGLSESDANGNYVNVSGDTMAGALVISYNGLGLSIAGTASGDVIHATRLLTVTGSAIFDGNARFNSTVTLNSVTYTFPASDGTSSGKVLKTNAAGQLSWSTDLNTGSSSNWSNTGSLQTAFDARYVNTAGDTMTGALLVKANLSGSRLIISGNAAVSGALVVVSNGTIRGTLSGNILHAEKDLTSSGTIIVTGIARLKNNLNVVGTISGAALQIMAGSTNYIQGTLGIGTTAPKAKLDVTGTISGNTLVISKNGSFSGTLMVVGNITTRGTFSGTTINANSLLTGSTIQGFGLYGCNGTANKITYNASTKKFLCEADQAVGSGLDQNAGDARYVNQSGDTMTGALLVKANLSGSRLIISGNAAVSGALIVVSDTTIRGTLSGNILHAEKTLTSSGSLTFEGAASGSTLYVATSINGAGLTDCDVATQTLNWDSSTGRFSCGTDSDTTYTAGQGLSLNGTSLSLASAFSGTSLKIYGTLSGNILHAEKTLTSSGTLIVLGTVTLRGTTSGNILHAEKTLTSSGSLTFEGAASGSTLYVATSINGAGLADCDIAGTSKLLWDSSTGRFSCGTDQNSGSGAPEVGTTSFTGAVLRLGDARYVNQSGDTMTGALLVKANLSGSRLIISGNAAVSGALIVVSDTTIRGTLSGNILHAEKTLTSSGTLIVLGTTTLRGTTSGNILHAEKTLTSSGSLTFEGAASGSTLYVATSINGAGLADCDIAGTSKLLWDSSTGRFSCGTDQNSGSGAPEVGTTSFTGAVLRLGDARYVNTSGDTMTGALLVKANLSGSRLIISGNAAVSGALIVVSDTTIRGTLSGNILHAEKTLTSSGSLTFEGAASGSTLYVATSINGAGLTDCDVATQTLNWDSSTGRFSCGTDSDTTYTAGQGLSLNGTSLSLASAFSGTSLKIYGTLSGNILHAEKTLTSSGTLIVLGTTTLRGTTSGNILHAEKTLTSSGSLTFEGAASGSTLYVATSINGAGLTDCDVATQTLNWDSSTGRFSCGTDSDTTYTAGQGLSLSATTFSLASAFSGTSLKIYGTLSGNILHAEKTLTSSGTLIVLGTTTLRGTTSGNILHAEKTLTSSGSLTFEGAASGSTLYVATSINGAGLADCDIAGTSKLLWDSSTGRFSCGTDQNSGSGAPEVGTTSFTGAVLRLGDARYVNQSGDTMTGALLVKANLSGSRLIISGNAAVSGALIVVSDTTIRGTLSGNILHAEKTLTSSGSLTFEGAASGSTLYVATSINGAGLTDCDVATQTLNWDSSTGRFSCGTDSDTTYTAGQGLSLNGTSLSLASAFSGTSLKIYGTLSGNILHAEKTLTSSGTLIVLGTTTLRGTTSGNILHAEKTLTSSGSLTFEGAASGSTLYVATSINGAGLADCDIAGTSKLLWDSSTGRFSCGTDQNSGSGAPEVGTTSFTGAVLRLGDARYVNTSGDTMTGALLVKANLSGSRLIISGNAAVSGALIVVSDTTIRGTLSGNILHAEKTLTSSGSLTFEGAASGSTLYVATSINGAGLTDCDVATQTLNWDSSTGRFSCGTDSDTTYTAGQGLSLSATTFSLASAFSGTSLKIYGTLSGNILHAEKTLTSSGTLIVLGTTTLRGTTSGNILHAEKTLTSSGSLTFEGAASGSTLYVATSINGAGLADCDIAGTSKLLWDSSTGRFSCGTDQNSGSGAPEVGTTSFTGAVLRLGDARYVNQSGDTMTGALLVKANLSGSRLIISGNAAVSGALIVVSDTTIRGTLSGNILHAEKTLTSSGSLTFEGAASGSTLYVATSINGAGLTDCDVATQTLNWDSSTGRFSCGTDSDTTYTAGQGLSLNGTSLSLASAFSGTSLKIYGTLSGNILHAEKTLTSSGTLIVLGTTTLRGTTSGNILHAEKTLTSSGSLTFEGAASGSTLYVATSINGAGLTDCDVATQTLNWDSSTGRFSCGTDSDTTYTAGQGLSLNGTSLSLASAFSGTSLKIYGTLSGNILHAEKTLTSSGTLIVLGTTTLRGTTSGNILHAEKTLTSSGSLTFEGAASGSTLYVATSINGAGLTDCDVATQTLNWDSSTGRFSCGTDSDTTYTAGQGLSLSATTFSLASAFSGTSLKIYGTLSGNILHAEKTLTSSGTLIVLGTTTLRGTTSGNILHAEKTLTSSGSLTFEGAASGSTLYVATSINGAGLTDCDVATQTLNWDSSTGRFSCGTDSDTTYTAGQGLSLSATTFSLASAFSGTSLKIYGTLSGNILHAEKTLTSSGTLIVLGTTTLRGTTSGNILHAEKTLTSSGTLTVVGAARLKSNLNVVGTISGAALQIMAGSTNYIQGTLGIGTTSPKAKLDVTGTISGNTLVISKNGSFSGTLMVVGNSTVRGTLSGTTINANSLLTGSTIQGFGLYGCQGTANKITYNASTKKFLCEADQTAGGSGNWSNTGSLQTSFDLRYVNQSGDTMTGALLVKANLSGSRLIISGNAAVSGALIVVGNTTIRGTLSGNVIHAEKNLTSSGYITAEGDITTQANFSGSNITITRSASISGTLLVKTSITSKGSLSGATFYGAGLGSCTGSTQKLLYDVATGKFSCGTDLNTGGSSAFGTGNVLTLGDARYVNQSGDTMTGALLVKANLSGSRLIISGNAAVSGALIVVGNTIIRGTLSGKILHAEKTLTSSGTLTFEGAASGSTLYVATSINGAGLTDCDVATQTLNWDSSAGRFSCGTDSDTTYTAGQGLSLNGTTFSLASAFSGTSLKIYGTLSGNVLHAEKTLTSSGTLVVLGTTTLRGTTSGNILHAEKTLTSSGSLTFEGAASGSTLYVATSINGAGLADCDVAATSKLLWDSSTGRFSCGTDQNSGSGAPEVGTTSFTGAVLRLGDARYVNTSGDTMTGALLVKANLSGSRLIISGNAAVSGALIVVSDTTIRGTLSGNILHAEKTLTSSGTLVVLGNSKFRATLSGNILHAEKTLTSSGTLTVVGAARLKSNLNVVGTISGAALQIMAGSTNYIQGTLGIGTTSPKAKLDVTGTISGNTLVISKNGSFSGTLMVVGNSTVRGTLSGTTINANSLLTGATIQGFGLYGCQGTANKITYNASTKKFLCEADQGSGAPEVGTSSFSGATLRLGDARYVNTSGDTMTGALTINLTSGSLGLKILNTASGNIIHAEKSLTSSGLLMVTQRLSQGSGAFVLNQLANSTGAYLRMSHTGSIHPLLVLDSVRQTWLSPAIMFGYRGSFDVSMQRTSTGVLALSGSLTIDQYLAVQKFAGATADAICYTSTGMLALCSSSLRYKEDVQDLSIGLTTLREMRPVNFKWKGRDQRDIGFIAEEVAAIDPMLATYNNAGEIQGVKYMQLTAVLTKAVQALDARLLGITNDAGTVLHARDLMTSSGALRVATIGTFGSGILLDTKYTDGSKTVFEVKSNVSSGSQTVFRINASGSVFTAGTFNSQGADYAEWFKSANKLRAGEVVCIDTLADNTVKRCENTADSNVMGIVSTRPAFIGNTIPGTEGLSNTSINRLGYYLIGLIGQVPARATLEGGDIRSGDALTSASDAGFIRKARAGESTVGVALEAFDGSSPFDAAQGNRVRTINVLISRRNSSMTVDAVSQKVLDTIASMEIGDEVKRMITASTQQLNLSGSIASAVSEQLGAFSIESRIGAAIDRRFSGAILSFGAEKTLHAAALDIESGATIRGNLRIEGTLILSAARAVLGPISISGSSVAIGSLMATGSLKVIGPITVEGLATFLGNVEIKGELSVSTKQAGIAAIAKNGTGVSVTFSGAFVHTPIVTATSDNFGAWRLRRRSLTGFTIELKDPADLDTTFTWLALSSVAPQRTSATGASVALIPFFVNAAGYPVSSDPVWNGCISGRLLADSDGVPFSCSRYHSDSMWDHPDLKISFIFNASHDPAILTIPEGYEVLTQSQEPVTVPEVETTSLSESASSESSSSESAPSEPAKTPVESDPPVIPETETGSIVNE